MSSTGRHHPISAKPMCLLVEAAARCSRELPGQAAAEVRVRAADVLSLGDAEVRPAERWVAAGRILGADEGDARVTASGTLGRARSANIVALAGLGRGGGRGGRRSGGGRRGRRPSRGRGGGGGGRGGRRPSRGRGGGGGGRGGRRPSRGGGGGSVGGGERRTERGGRGGARG